MFFSLLFFFYTVRSFRLQKKMQKSNYSATLITLLIVTITLSHYRNSQNRKCKLQIALIFGHFTLLIAHCQCVEH